MRFESRNPATGALIATHPMWSHAEIDTALSTAIRAQSLWRRQSFQERATVLTGLARGLRERQESMAEIATEEMGKPLSESRSEIMKCALVCEFYAEHAARFLAAESAPLPIKAARVEYEPLGLVLAIMPWNFPYWQVMRFLAPALMAGNAVVLKHAPNVQGAASMLESVLSQAGLPRGLLSNFPIPVDFVPDLIAHPAVRAVAVTGSEKTGRQVASLAGHHLKKLVLELGGSDPFIVLDDANLPLALDAAVQSRYTNAGQACIAAKRFILLPGIADAFTQGLQERVAALRVGDPRLPDTQIGPLAREDLRDQCHHLVSETLLGGAKKLIGCQMLPGPGYFYAPSILDHVPKDASARQEEVFGPVASIIRVKDLDEALMVANETRFGLGASLFTDNLPLAESLTRDIEAGLVFVNAVVKSDPNLPFGGIKASGYGRELSYHGIREFCQAKTIWIP